MHFKNIFRCGAECTCHRFRCSIAAWGRAAWEIPFTCHHWRICWRVVYQISMGVQKPATQLYCLAGGCDVTWMLGCYPKLVIFIIVAEFTTIDSTWYCSTLHIAGPKFRVLSEKWNTWIDDYSFNATRLKHTPCEFEPWEYFWRSVILLHVKKWNFLANFFF